VTAVASGCGLVVSPKFGRRHESPPPEQQPWTSHLRADVGSCIAECYYFWFRFRYVLKLNTSVSMYLFCNSRIHVITLYLGHVCVYYASMLWCWHLVWILVRTDHSCLGVGCHTSGAIYDNCPFEQSPNTASLLPILIASLATLLCASPPPLRQIDPPSLSLT
jgi:hypothetical protein